MLKQKDLKRVTLIQACIKGECTVKQVANREFDSFKSKKSLKALQMLIFFVKFLYFC